MAEAITVILTRAGGGGGPPKAVEGPTPPTASAFEVSARIGIIGARRPGYAMSHQTSGTSDTYAA